MKLANAKWFLNFDDDSHSIKYSSQDNSEEIERSNVTSPIGKVKRIDRQDTLSFSSVYPTDPLTPFLTPIKMGEKSNLMKKALAKNYLKRDSFLSSKVTSFDAGEKHDRFSSRKTLQSKSLVSRSFLFTYFKMYAKPLF